MRFQLIVMLLVALLLILVTVQNPNPVSLQFLSWEAPQVPQIIVILISLMAGVIVSSVLSLKTQWKLKERVRRLTDELEDLKNPPSASEEDEVLKD